MRLVAALGLALLVVGGAQAARLVGTNADDVLVGTPRSDTIFGLGGADRIRGLAGDDFLHGGPGRDMVDGGPGNDRIAVEYDGSRDTVRCGRGFDTVNADLLDSVASDCELVGRRLSRDPYTNPESQHETQAEPDSFTAGRTTVAAYQVGRRFEGAATNIGYSVSNDGGRTWQSGLLPGLTVASRPAGSNTWASDPVVAYDATAGVWLIATLALDPQATRLTVSRSSDGVSWSRPVVAIESRAGRVAFDKEWIVCDNGSASAFRGTCYLAYTDILRGDALSIVSSKDGGATWSAPVTAPVREIVGVFPVVRPNGDLVLPFLWRGRSIGSSTSTDGGLSFTAPVLVADLQVRSARGLRFFPLPAADVDPSGRVWLTWHDCRFSAGCRRNAVVVSTSDNGQTWTAPTALTSGRNAMLPAIGIHPVNGRVAIAYHVVRPDGGVDVELRQSRAGGRQWGPHRRLSARTMRPEWMANTRSGRMLADYISVHYAGARPLTVWVLASEPVRSSLRQAVYATR